MINKYKYVVLGCLLLACALLLGAPASGSAASYNYFPEVANAMRAADQARDLYYQNKSGKHADRYEREWRAAEFKLENARIERMARESRASSSEIRKMRESGRSWDQICKHYRVDAQKMGFGHKGPHGYDRDRDHDIYKHFYKGGKR